MRTFYLELYEKDLNWLCIFFAVYKNLLKVVSFILFFEYWKAMFAVFCIEYKIDTHIFSLDYFVHYNVKIHTVFISSM